jgi:hypothetical protein
MTSGLPKEASYFWASQVARSPHGDVTHGFASPRENTGRIEKLRAAREAQIDVPNEHVDVTDPIVDDALGRTVQEDYLRTHGEDVLVARSHLFMDQTPKADRQRPHLRIVRTQEFEQLGWSFNHPM